MQMKKLNFLNYPDDPYFWMAVSYLLFVGMYAWYVFRPHL